MRTLLSQFCEEFDGAVRPLLEPLLRTAETLGQSPDEDHAGAVLPALNDVAEQFRVLADKVAEQQAYVLIFGPLKSGKSTLMNAMSAAYVSEVTSLPAYPCMVYVSDSDTRGFTVTRYSGESQEFRDPAALRLQVARAHAELAERIREVEAGGTEFDPVLHFDAAIRRVDVRVPAGELAQSGSVLVDTPGLYSRMKFGYDRMTREFRNAAACAIFVVKTDNLFLEQVFNEFNQLLDLFSRIFLVVNLDSTKRDVMPDGELVPSLESDDPRRVVEAFENLSMSAPLKAAADEGRLRIYPVDLMQAASRRLSGQPAEEPAGSGQADFESFMKDLTDYLNSTDYLVAFLGDSLRRAEQLLDETDGITGHETVQAIARRVGELEGQRRTCNDRLQALDRLAVYDWMNALRGLERELLTVGRRESEAICTEGARAIAEHLERWFQSDASLANLLEGELAPMFEASQRGLALSVHGRLSAEVATGASGISLPHEVARDLFTLGLQFGQFGRDGLDEVNPIAGLDRDRTPLTPGDIPVRRTWIDWLLFRSKARVRTRLFGEPGAPTQRIPREQKARRLGDAARTVMQERLAEYQEQRLPAILEGITRRIFGDYAKAVTGALEERLAARRLELSAELEALDADLKAYRRVQNRIEELAVETSRTRGAIEELGARYHETDPDHLVQPVPPPSPEDAIRRPASIPEAFVEEIEPEVEVAPEVRETPGDTRS
jgi:energy-coupling factor transporter ATP-binding protein EcfA2